MSHECVADDGWKEHARRLVDGLVAKEHEPPDELVLGDHGAPDTTSSRTRTAPGTAGAGLHMLSSEPNGMPFGYRSAVACARLIARASICRTRSRVTPSTSPISPSVASASVRAPNTKRSRWSS